LRLHSNRADHDFPSWSLRLSHIGGLAVATERVPVGQRPAVSARGRFRASAWFIPRLRSVYSAFGHSELRTYTSPGSGRTLSSPRQAARSREPRSRSVTPDRTASRPASSSTPERRQPRSAIVSGLSPSAAFGPDRRFSRALGVMPKPDYRRQGPTRHDCPDGLRRGSRLRDRLRCADAR
jgi:hypothetical protein